MCFLEVETLSAKTSKVLDNQEWTAHLTSYHTATFPETWKLHSQEGELPTGKGMWTLHRHHGRPTVTTLPQSKKTSAQGARQEF